MIKNRSEKQKMCELHAAGLLATIDQRCQSPEFICGKCRRKADQAEYLHNPQPLKKITGDSFWS